MDVDFVIHPTTAQLRALVQSLEQPGIYVSAEAALEALERESMFNVVDTTSGWKADLIIRKSRPFSQAEFARRQSIEFEGISLWVATVEDTILAKLEWAALSDSARQLEDVSALIRVAGQLDHDYLDRWIAELGLQEPWQTAQQRGAG